MSGIASSHSSEGSCTLAVVAERWNPDRGGRERYAADLIAYLQAEGRLVTRAEPQRLDGDRESRILALTPVPHATHYQLHSGLLASAFEGERESMSSVVRRRFFGPALAVNCRRQQLMDHESRLLEGQTQLMAFSGATARALVGRGVARSRVAVSRPGVDLERFPPRSTHAARADHASLQLTFVGHNFALKGLHAAIQALAMLCRGGLNASLTVAGRGPIRAFRRLAERERVADRIHFAGAMSQHDVARLHRASDALIHPAFYDPFPRVVVEALASGCPVITTTRCGAAEIITHGRHGFIVDDPHDVAGLAEAASQLADRDEHASLSRAAAELGQSFDQARHFGEASRWIFAETRA